MNRIIKNRRTWENVIGCVLIIFLIMVFKKIADKENYYYDASIDRTIYFFNIGFKYSIVLVFFATLFLGYILSDIKIVNRLETLVSLIVLNSMAVLSVVKHNSIEFVITSGLSNTKKDMFMLCLDRIRIAYYLTILIYIIFRLFKSRSLIRIILSMVISMLATAYIIMTSFTNKWFIVCVVINILFGYGGLWIWEKVIRKKYG